MPLPFDHAPNTTPDPGDVAAAHEAGRGGSGIAGDEVMIRAEGLSKKFRLYPGPWARLSEWLSLGKRQTHEPFWALREVNFEVRRGESLGVIGANGSGKSTLLKILSGAMYPTEGKFEVQGRVLSLLELGTGLNPELTGRQNVINSARLLAFESDYATRKMSDIEGFAELGDFFDRPIRLYSSGMIVRLVFSMFACFDPDVFIVDEALSVGDIYFQQKCATRIRQMLDAGVTMLFVSHDLAAVEALCDRVLLLDHGTVRHFGDKAVGIRMYYAVTGAGGAGKPRHTEPFILEDGVGGNGEKLAQATTACFSSDRGVTSSPADLPWQFPDERDQIGDGSVRITGICWRRDDGANEPVVEQNGWLELFAQFEAVTDVGPVNCGVTLFDRLNRLIFARGWINAEVEPVTLKAGERFIAKFRIKLDVELGEYTVSLAAAEALRDASSSNGWNQAVGGDRYAELPHASRLAVLPRSDGRRLSYGLAHLPNEIVRFEPHHDPPGNQISDSEIRI